MLSQRLRSLSILDATPYLHAGYRCCAACASTHLYTSFPNRRRVEACAKDNNLYPVWGDYTIWKMLGQRQSSPHYHRRVGGQENHGRGSIYHVRQTSAIGDDGMMGGRVCRT